jgi:hypothetical protein
MTMLCMMLTEGGFPVRLHARVIMGLISRRQST